jgi:hypothetical protein
MRDGNPAPPSARHVRKTLAARAIGIAGLVLSALCLAMVASGIVFWSER